MPNLLENTYITTNTNKTNYYIEAATYLGNGIKAVLNNYKNIYSIELSKKWT